MNTDDLKNETPADAKHVLPAVLLDVEMIVGDNTALLIQYPTRIEYEVQAGGLGCTHPTCEGFCINIGSLGQDFDDCSYGCYWIDQDEENQKKLAKDLEKYLEEKTKDWRYQILFDYDRLDELQEGWWPVVVIGKINGGIIATENVNWKGYVHTGNCD